MRFAYQAMTLDGRLVSDRLEAGSPAEAAESLRAKGLTVLQLGQADERERAASAARSARRFGLRGVRSGDLVLLTRQFKMLLEAGSAVVPALEAIEHQAARPAVAALVRQIREHVEQGGSLADAFEQRPDVFKPIFSGIVSAGEATAKLPEAFGHLNELMARQQRVRKAVLGALLYPLILSLLCVAVAGVVLGFVVPRFRRLFETLDTPLPALTSVMFAASDQAVRHWPIGVAVVVGLLVAAVIVLRVRQIRTRLDALVLDLPIIGRLGRRLAFARVVRIWAATLRCHVPLLEAIRHSRTSVSNARFQALVRDVEEAVAAGSSMARALAESGLVEPVIASAIRTGEENGRLTEAVEFVSRWLDDDNAQLVTGLARVAEPAMIAFMGIFVGLVAMSLFIPLFDLATAAG